MTVGRPLSISGGATLEVGPGALLAHRGSIQFGAQLTKTGEGAQSMTSYGGSGSPSPVDLAIEQDSVEFLSSHYNGCLDGAIPSRGSKGFLRVTVD